MLSDVPVVDLYDEFTLSVQEKGLLKASTKNFNFIFIIQLIVVFGNHNSIIEMSISVSVTIFLFDFSVLDIFEIEMSNKSDMKSRSSRPDEEVTTSARLATPHQLHIN